jgi:hypothetical protein
MIMCSANGAVKPLIRKSLRNNFRIKITSTLHPPRHGLQKRILFDYSDRVERMCDELTNEILRDLEEIFFSNRDFYINLTVRSDRVCVRSVSH